MRPVKQLLVISTHVLQAYAPVAGFAFGASVLVTHVARFAFVFISACMLVYAYPQLDDPARLRRFWRRRVVSIALPYATWSVIYVGYLIIIGNLSGSPSQLITKGLRLMITGYDQLYFLLLLLEFNLIYPLFIRLINKTSGHHRVLVAVSAALAVVLDVLLHWGYLPGWMSGRAATRELWNYQFFLVLGAVAALWIEELCAWLASHWPLVLGIALGTGLLAEGWYGLAKLQVVPWFAGTDVADAFQPTELPFYVALIAVIALAGIRLARPGLPGAVKKIVGGLVDNSYGVYLCHILMLGLLTRIGWGRLAARIGWPLTAVGALLITYLSSCLLTAMLARLPGAIALTGRRRQPLPIRPRRLFEAAEGVERS